MPATKKKVELETSLQELESIVSQMESGELSLEQSLKAFEQGIKLTRECQQRLTDAETQVKLLLEQNGELTLNDFDQPETL
ncbi:exodeoxyribonuclease VII small subunit [Gilvimarinus agarilyticus]|uniref:exodeoxyribonuclease VII small subunit n=1 Tax=unclassified Gilvimarinus TaxID=2642066 RepID=UPI001C08490E|nr:MULTISPECIES: exodeoxyribonuclease VII small subunit [unclassified Gilvimarinus]MBU2885322.1 exodeoxyribonuclease VII small subunit [Gilvimarinus agarilyticus]MDO6570221.1 exodeoxyribonuclease VII small subunit [Gilvimarinus sp. 2_MG-2023]MDO6748216.1 exodeoxyribonuclease VII small subunit [Gilvimarinus sp. 1_MG-2023]